MDVLGIVSVCMDWRTIKTIFTNSGDAWVSLKWGQKARWDIIKRWCEFTGGCGRNTTCLTDCEVPVRFHWRDANN